MARAFSVNLQPASGAAAMLNLKDFLVASGNMFVQASGMGTNVALGPTVPWTANTVATLTIAAGDENKVGKLYGFCHDKNGSGQANVVSMTWCYETVTLPAAPGSVNTTGKWDFVSGFVLDSAATVAAAHLYVKVGASVVYDITTGLTGRRRDELTTAVLMAGAYAWFVLESYDTTYPYQLCFSRQNSDTNWYLYYSTKDLNGSTSGGGFCDNVAFTCKYDTKPSAYDVHTMLNSSLWLTANTYMQHLICDAGAPYGWVMFTTVRTSGLIGGLYFVDPMLVGSYSSDPDPRVIGAYYSNNGGSAGLDLGGESYAYYCISQAHLKKGISGESFTYLNPAKYVLRSSAQYAFFPYTAVGAGTDPSNGKEVLVPVPWGKSSFSGGTYGWKGISTLFHWCGSNRGNNDTLSVAGTKDYVYITSGLVLPWDGATTPIW